MHELKRVLVTGGGGFLGGHLCERLLDDGIEVVCVDDLSTSAPTAASRLRGRPGYHFVRHDISEPLIGRHTDVDTVFHLASPASPVDYLRLPVQTLRTGALGTANALDIAERCGARLVLASTSEVYGDPLQHPQPETYWGNVNPVGPRSVYDEAKRFAEALTFAYRRVRSADVAVARIFNTYGPRMRADDGRMVPTFCTQALAGKPITVTGTGEQTRSLCYVDDTVDALVALAQSDCAGPVNVGNPDEVSVLHIAELIRDLTVARDQLGWRPRIGYRAGLELTLAWFRAQLPVDTATSPALQGS
jgi:dTDP-glucose 4,6-dehydratase